MEDFQYLPLDPGEPCFRLLKLIKGNTIEVECEIFNGLISDHSTVPYEALSYAWGLNELVERIKLNGKVLRVTENLHSALQCLRSCDQDRILWIDAICIDQSNMEERSQQVQKMSSIFGFASRVIFWLGKPTAEVEFLLKSLSELQAKSALYSHEDSEVDGVHLKELWSNIQLTPGRQDDEQASRLRKGLQVLLARPWFRRVWILQEVANAHSAIVCVGKLSIPAHIFAVSPLLLGLDTDAHVQSVLDIIPGSARTKSWWSRERDLFSLLVKFRASGATDKRDMVFALLGISSEPVNHRLLRADYTKPIEYVIHDAIRYWFQASCIPVRRVLDLLIGFKTFHTTCLVMPNQADTQLMILDDFEFYESIEERTFNEIVDKIDCYREPALFLLEQYPGKGSSDETNCHMELDKLQAEIRSGPFQESVLKGSVQIISWKSEEQNIRLLIVNCTERALLTIGKYGLRRTFDFILDQCVEYKQQLLDSVLLRASERDDLITAKLSIDRGANANTHRALHAAAYTGNYSIVQLLLDHGADATAPGNGLQWASMNGHHDIVQMLLDHGANVNAQVFLRNSRGIRDSSALHEASFYGHHTIVQLLLDRGAHVHAHGGLHDTALKAAAKGGYFEVAQLLLQHGADTEAQGGQYGSTALKEAANGGHHDIVQLLLNHGADVNSQGGESGTALWAAARWGHLSTVQLLLDRGADIDAQGEYLGTPLQAASHYRQHDVVQLLLDRGAEVDLQR